MGPLHLVDFIMFRDGLDRRCFCVYTRSIFISHRRNPFASSLFCLVHRKFLEIFFLPFSSTRCVYGAIIINLMIHHHPCALPSEPLKFNSIFLVF